MPVRELVLLGAAAAWGLTFLGTKIGLDSAGPITFVAARCFIAAIAVTVLCAPRLRTLGWAEWGAGILVGSVVALALGLQTAGLAWLPSSKSGFLTALYVPTVPLLMLLLGKKPSKREWAGVILAFLGLVALSIRGLALELGAGELLTVGCALAFAVQIILTGRLATRVDPMALSITQLWVAAILAGAIAALAGEAPPSLSAASLGIALAMGLIGTAFPILGMTWAQQRVPAPRTTVLLATEPIWAGMIGAAAGEQITAAMALGCALIVMGVLVSEGVLGTRLFKAAAEEPSRCHVDPNAA